MEVILLPVCLWFLFSMFVADLGKMRTIGYGPAFILSLLLSPIIGFIIVLLSPTEVKVVVTNNSGSDGPLKTCPDCAEEVKDAARKCKHCGYRWE